MILLKNYTVEFLFWRSGVDCAHLSHSPVAIANVCLTSITRKRHASISLTLVKDMDEITVITANFLTFVLALSECKSKEPSCIKGRG